MDKEYAGIAGLKGFVTAATGLAYGKSLYDKLRADDRLAAVQSISGTGALRIGAAFLHRFYSPSHTVMLPAPTWGNHGPILKDAGLSSAFYRYFDAKTNGLDFKGTSGRQFCRHDRGFGEGREGHDCPPACLCSQSNRC